MKILAYRFTEGSHASCIASEITYPDLSTLLNWLIFSHSSVVSSCLKVVWNLGDLVQLITKDLPEDIRDQLARPPHRARWGSYKLFTIPDKMFSVNKNGCESNFYDLSQYFPEEPEEPETLRELQYKADLLENVLVGLGVTRPESLASPVRAYSGQGLLKRVQDIIPTVFDAVASHLEAFDIALQCTPREWVCNYQVGSFPKLWGYDLASAYPFQASRLVDLRDCTFSRSTEMRENAYYGFLIGDFTIYPDHPLAFCSPFLADRGDGVLTNFVGTKRNFTCLLEEVRTLYRHEMGEFRLKSGWFLSPTSGVRPRFPFANLMSQLYGERTSRSGSSDLMELQSYFVKRIMNGLIGKLLETHRDQNGNVIEYGKLYNPIYHALCTTNTRLQVFEFLVQYALQPTELVHIGVDGVKTTRYINLPAKSSMGKWRSSGCEPAVIFSPGGVVTPRRNFKRLGYEELVEKCVEKPGSHLIYKVKDDPIDLHKLFLNQTRSFSKLPRTAKELLEAQFLSEPIVFES